MLQKILDWFKSLRSNDPVYSCIVYKRHGCSHVDGILCDIKTCDIHKGAAGFILKDINKLKIWQ